MKYVHPRFHSSTAPVIDPMCGMKVDPAAAKHRHRLGDINYYFCSKACLEKFKANPGQYTKESTAQRGSCCHGHRKSAPSAQPVKDVIYTCPMHSEVRRLGPGTCPICGMALEPE